MNAVTVTTKQQLWQREAEAFRKIPGMDLLLRSQRETLPDLEVKYPDAAFAAFFLCPLEIELSGSTHCLLKKVFQLRSAGRSLVERKRERPFRESPDRITLFMPLHFFVNLGVEFELCAVDRIVLDV